MNDIQSITHSCRVRSLLLARNQEQCQVLQLNVDPNLLQKKAEGGKGFTRTGPETAKAKGIMGIQMVESASQHFQGLFLYTLMVLSTLSAEPIAMGEPRSASRGSTGQRLGATDSMASLVAVSAHINSDLSWLRCNPKSNADLSIKLRW